MSKRTDHKVFVVQPNRPSPSETFINAHSAYLPARVTVIHGGVPTIGDRPIKSQALVPRALRKAARIIKRQTWQDEVTSTYLSAFRSHQPQAVLAEYGTTATSLMDACSIAGIPLIAHFHGHDASRHDCIQDYLTLYRILFQKAQALIAVSKVMREVLIGWGASPEKVYLCPYGVDCTQFIGANPGLAPPEFIAVGRLVEKKSPLTTIRAFASVQHAYPEAKLRIIGFGPLEEQCRNLVVELGIEGAVEFLGACSPEIVRKEMRRARAFVQHSKVAADGDSEGTPVAIIEAGAMGLPVVSTRHAGIPDVVIEGETGFLVDEGDEEGMAEHMRTLVREPQLAGKMGESARERISSNFSIERSIERLWKVIESCIEKGDRLVEQNDSRDASTRNAVRI